MTIFAWIPQNKFTNYRFHPAIQRVRRILDSGSLGAIKGVSVNLTLTKGIVKEGDIRYDYSLGGGAMMDLGCTSPIVSVLEQGTQRKFSLPYVPWIFDRLHNQLYPLLDFI
jgi:hypothetical protein